MVKNKLFLILKRALISLCLFLAISGGAWLYLNGWDNFHAVVDGEVYRSAQFNSGQLKGYAEKYGIKSVLNLRGPNQGSAWWEEEVAISEKLGVKHYDLALSSKYELTPEQIQELLVILREAPKPLLIHCAHGADRSALAAAIYLHAVKGYPCAKARAQLSVLHGHIPWYRPNMGKTFNKFCNAN